MPVDLVELVRERVKEQLPELDTRKVFLSATHTHTAPEVRLGLWLLPKEGVMQVEEYREFFAERVSDAVVKAWKGRAPGSVSWGLGHAVVAQNRRVVRGDHPGVTRDHHVLLQALTCSLRKSGTRRVLGTERQTSDEHHGKRERSALSHGIDLQQFSFIRERSDSG